MGAALPAAKSQRESKLGFIISVDTATCKVTSVWTPAVTQGSRSGILWTAVYKTKLNLLSNK